ncbi:hypothetical protein GCM10020295_01990 [Streptomyces cinereospinus]
MDAGDHRRVCRVREPDLCPADVTHARNLQGRPKHGPTDNPANPPGRSATKASRSGALGPGRPGRPSPDTGVGIRLVPVIPQTGQTWTPSTRPGSALPPERVLRCSEQVPYDVTEDCHTFADGGGRARRVAEDQPGSWRELAMP